MILDMQHGFCNNKKLNTILPILGSKFFFRNDIFQNQVRTTTTSHQYLKTIDYATCIFVILNERNSVKFIMQKTCRGFHSELKNGKNGAI